MRRSVRLQGGYPARLPALAAEGQVHHRGARATLSRAVARAGARKRAPASARSAGARPRCASALTTSVRFRSAIVRVRRAPRARLSQLFHPNIDFDGNVCLNILRAEWKPVLDLTAVVAGLIILFTEPNTDDPLNIGACARARASDVLRERRAALALRRASASPTPPRQPLAPLTLSPSPLCLRCRVAATSRGGRAPLGSHAVCEPGEEQHAGAADRSWRQKLSLRTSDLICVGKSQNGTGTGSKIS